MPGGGGDRAVPVPRSTKLGPWSVLVRHPSGRCFGIGVPTPRTVVAPNRSYPKIPYVTPYTRLSHGDTQSYTVNVEEEEGEMELLRIRSRAGAILNEVGPTREEEFIQNRTSARVIPNEVGPTRCRATRRKWRADTTDRPSWYWCSISLHQLEARQCSQKMRSCIAAVWERTWVLPEELTCAAKRANVCCQKNAASDMFGSHRGAQGCLSHLHTPSMCDLIAV